LALGVLPLELLLLLLLLAGADPGPFPALERLLCWGLGALAPALLLWRRPADVWSLLLVQAPLRARSETQRRLSRIQSPLGLKLALGAGAAGLLPLLWWLDRWAALASPYTPLGSSPRLLGLVLAAGVLALLLWQWQQLLQALWLLSRPQSTVGATAPMTASEMEASRLSLGLPLLLLPPLAGEANPAEPSGSVPPRPSNASDSAAGTAPSQVTQVVAPSDAVAVTAPDANQTASPAQQPSGEPLADGDTAPEPDSLIPGTGDTDTLAAPDDDKATSPAQQPSGEPQADGDTAPGQDSLIPGTGDTETVAAPGADKATSLAQQPSGEPQVDGDTAPEQDPLIPGQGEAEAVEEQS